MPRPGGPSQGPPKRSQMRERQDAPQHLAGRPPSAHPFHLPQSQSTNPTGQQSQPGDAQTGRAYNPRPPPKSTRLCQPIAPTILEAAIFGRARRAGRQRWRPPPPLSRPPPQKIPPAPPAQISPNPRSANSIPSTPRSDGVGPVIQGDRVFCLGEKQPTLDDEPERGAGQCEPGRHGTRRPGQDERR